MISPQRVPCEIEVYDVRGRLVAQVFDGALEPGGTTLEWDGRGKAGRRVSSGVYILRVRSPLDEISAKITVLW